MNSSKFFKSDSETKEKVDFDPIEDLLDPVRSKILFETVLRGKTTAEMLEKTTQRSKSTISHHLKKLVLGGILQVSVSPTGKTKYYQISEKMEDRGFAFKIDKESLLEASKEEQFNFILDLFRVNSVMSHVFSNLFSDQVEFLKNKGTLDNTYVDSEDKIKFQVNELDSKIPIQLSTIASEEAVNLISKRIRELIIEIDEKFGPAIERIRDPTLNPKYLVNLEIFPYFIEE